MLNSKYILMDTVIHKLNPVFKIISLILMLVTLAFTNSYIDILMLGGYLLLCIVYSDISIKVYLENLINVKILFIIVLIIDLIIFRGINTIIFDIFRLIFIVIYLSIISYTTALTEITYGISTLLKPFNKIIPTNDISLISMLTIRYIPIFTYEYNKINKVRGINYSKKDIKNKLKYKYKIFKRANKLTLNKIRSLIDIMDIRLYNYGKSRTNYRYNKWTNKNSLLLVLNILILIIVISY